MVTKIARIGWTQLEIRTILAGSWLVGLAVAVTAVSYVMYSTFPYRWLVWAVTAVFAAVAFLAFEWPRALRRAGGGPEGRLRQLLLLSMPLAFVLSSQVCGLGIRACNAACQVINLSMIGLAAATVIRFQRGRPVGSFLVPLVVVSLVPHCVCHVPINLLWHRILGGFALTCEMLPLAAVLFAASAIRGARPRSSTTLAAAMFGVMVFVIVGGLLFGFPWQGCVDHTV